MIIISEDNNARPVHDDEENKSMQTIYNVGGGETYNCPFGNVLVLYVRYSHKYTYIFLHFDIHVQFMFMLMVKKLNNINTVFFLLKSCVSRWKRRLRFWTNLCGWHRSSISITLLQNLIIKDSSMHEQNTVPIAAMTSRSLLIGKYDEELYCVYNINGKLYKLYIWKAFYTGSKKQ